MVRAGSLAARTAAVITLILTTLTSTCLCRAESLQDAWYAALLANQGLQAAQNATASARSSQAAARAERLPTLSTFNAYTWLNNSPSFKSSVSLPGSAQPISLSLPFLNREFFVSSTLMNIPLYTGGRVSSGIEAANAQAGAARAEEFTAALDLKLEVAQAYLKVLRLGKLLRLAESNVANLQAHERDVRNLFKEGVAKRTDLLASQVSLAKARQRLIQARNDRDVASASYNRLLGRPLTSPADLDEMFLQSEMRAIDPPKADELRKTSASGTEKLPEALPGAAAIRAQPENERLAATGESADKAEIEELTANALASRSELTALSHQAQTYAAQARGVESLKKPQVGLTGGFNYISDTHLAVQDYWSGTFGASWLLMDSHRASNKAQALRLKEGQTIKQRNDTASKIALAVRSSWLSLQSSRSALEVAKEAIAQADENLEETLNRYKEQVVTNTEVLDAETLRLQAYTDYYTAMYAVLLDQYTLRRAVGTL